MRVRLKRALAGLDRLAKSVGRPVLLTEVGYRAVQGTAVSPHTWPDPTAKTFDQRSQARAYQVLFSSLRDQRSLAGVFLWKWYTDPPGDEGPAGFSPRGYEAEALWASAFGGNVPAR